MGDKSDIQWTDATWNPVTGCLKVSPGCAHCYAEGVAKRFWATQYPKVKILIDGAHPKTGEPVTVPFDRPRLFTDVQCHEDRLDQPLRWKKPRRVFVNSMSDLFHEDVPDVFIDRVFAVMALAPQHTFQILTKRAERMRAYMAGDDLEDRLTELWQGDDQDKATWSLRLPLSNVWLGVSVENQHFADERIPLLLQTPAAIRFLSCEPLLEGLDLAKHRPGANRLWVIVGGESGSGARPCDVKWVRSIVRQCQESDTPVFVKQLGALTIDKVYVHPDLVGKYDGPETTPIRLHDRKGGDMAEWPEDLRVREMPAARS